ncbi:hypothetical protein K525DRAFT_170919, partial [Schizophyllum commune Loenen D]
RLRANTTKKSTSHWVSNSIVKAASPSARRTTGTMAWRIALLTVLHSVPRRRRDYVSRNRGAKLFSNTPYEVKGGAERSSTPESSSPRRTPTGSLVAQPAATCACPPPPTFARSAYGGDVLPGRITEPLKGTPYSLVIPHTLQPTHLSQTSAESVLRQPYTSTKRGRHHSADIRRRIALTAWLKASDMRVRAARVTAEAATGNFELADRLRRVDGARRRRELQPTQVRVRVVAARIRVLLGIRSKGASGRSWEVFVVRGEGRGLSRRR